MTDYAKNNDKFTIVIPAMIGGSSLNKFKELYPTDNTKPKKFVKEVQIDTDFEILFPDDYINSISERLSLYNKLGELKTEEELQQFEVQLIDRFGELPIQVVDLLDSAKLQNPFKKGVVKDIIKPIQAYLDNIDDSEF